MSETPKPEPITFSDGTNTAFTSTPMLTGTTATLSGGESMAAPPMSQNNVKFVMGPNGQMIAIQKEPFVWKKFFIGLGVPVFLMVIPLILSLYADSMSNWDDDYEYESIDLELVNGTAYTGTYTLDSSMVIEWCSASSFNNSAWYDCHHENDDSEMHIHEILLHEVTLVRENGTVIYSTNFSLQEGESLVSCDIEVRGDLRDSWYYCPVDYQETDEFGIFKETWDDGNYNSEKVGQWNATSGQIQFHDGEDHGAELNLRLSIEKEIGQWTAATGTFNIDSGNQLDEGFIITIETMDRELYDQTEADRGTIDMLLAISMFMCCSAPVVTIGMIIYGFAATGGKPVGIGAVVALVAYPFIGFFTMITSMMASW